MIKVEGFKAFRGVLKVTPKTDLVPPFEVEGEFLYNPENDCWYGCGRSFLAGICEIVRDDT